MAPTTAVRRGPVHPLAWAALATSLVAAVLALYGSFMSERHIAGSPLNAARNRPGLEATETSKTTRYTLQFVAYFVPFGLGIAGALGGGEAMKAIERRGGRHSGNLQAVFAIMIGGLAAVVAGVMIAAGYLWKYAPTFYTY